MYVAAIAPRCIPLMTNPRERPCRAANSSCEQKPAATLPGLHGIVIVYYIEQAARVSVPVQHRGQSDELDGIAPRNVPAHAELARASASQVGESVGSRLRQVLALEQLFQQDLRHDASLDTDGRITTYSIHT
jgi:hypothetical protein